MGAQSVQREPQSLQHGDQPAPKPIQLPGRSQGPWRYPRNGAKSFDGSYTQTDLRPSVDKTSMTAESFLEI